jgi:hypothetical protein
VSAPLWLPHQYGTVSRTGLGQKFNEPVKG